MNTQCKLQICAGIGAVSALPLIYLGLKMGGTGVPWLGVVLFGLSMMVTPVLRVMPSPSHARNDDV